VRDLCLDELAIARGEHLHATRCLLADLLDLRHSLPRVWVALQALRVEPWVARKVASLSRNLSREAVRVVDAAVALAAGQGNGRTLAIAEAKVIEADQAARAADLDAAKVAKGVWLTSTREEAPGLRSIFARIEAGDAVWVEATVQRVADLLATDPDLRAVHHPELGEHPSPDELRAAAFGWLARPHDLAGLLGLLGLLDEKTSEEEQSSRRHRATVFVHLHQAALDGTTTSAVARTSLGPLLLDQVIGLLGHAHVTLTPVIDLNTGSSVNGYEHPETVKQRTLLRNLGPVFPHANALDVHVDHDHCHPYDPGGPPGQTGDHHDAPLDRHSHRTKTHLAYQVQQLAPATYLWTTPTGLHRLVNHTGTHPITDDDLDLIRRIYAA
jgi:hypothetical protein